MINNLIDSTTKAVKQAMPGIESLTKKRKKMIDTLLMAGYKKKEIIDFLYLTSGDVAEYIEIKKEAVKLAKEIIVKPVAKP